MGGDQIPSRLTEYKNDEREREREKREKERERERNITVKMFLEK